MTRKQHAKTRRGTGAVMEIVELRRLLSTVVVDTLADETVANSTTSLREAIQLATASDTVAFKSGLAGTITLGGEQLLIDKSLTISGPGAKVLGISANNASRAFEVEHGTTVTLSELTIKQGRAQYGGGIDNYGVLTLNNVVVADNTARGHDGSSSRIGGNPAFGGGIFNRGTLTLEQSTFTNNVVVGGTGIYDGQFGYGAGGAASGGAIYNDVGGTIAVNKTNFLTNAARGGGGVSTSFVGGAGGAARGGGIYTAGSVTITGGRFADNAALGSDGADGDYKGGIPGDAEGGAIASEQPLSVSNVLFEGNRAIAGDPGRATDLEYYEYEYPPDGGYARGGAVYSRYSLGDLEDLVQSDYAPVDIIACTFRNNVARGGDNGGQGAGGGAYSAANILTVVDSTFTGNSAVSTGTLRDTWDGTPAFGGGIVAYSYLSITGSTFDRNSAAAGAGGNGIQTYDGEIPAGDGGQAMGGGVYAAAHPASISRSTFYSNSLHGGDGGGYASGGRGGDASGAGIYATDDTNLTACTVAANTATGGLAGVWTDAPNGQGDGGGVRALGSLTIANLLIATNAADVSPDVAGATTSQGFNLIGKSDGSSGWIASDKRGTIATPLDPKLGPLAGNGGPTKTMALLAGSPALDAGKAFSTSTDQRGAKRPLNLAAVANAPGSDGADIGAFELQSLPAGQTPFKNFVIGATPLTIQAEDFDSGGDGVAYHDVDTANAGGAYRSTGVDLQSTTDTGGGVNVGWTKAGEWLEYTVKIEQSGYYTVDFRVASNGPGGTFHFEFDGSDVTGPLTVPNTFGWQKWTTIHKDGAYLGAGTYVLRLKMDANGPTGWVGNFNHLKISRGVVNLVTGTAAHVRDGAYRFANYGSSQGLEVKKSTTGYNRETYLQFDTSNVATISGAKLRLYGSLMDTASPSIQLGVFASPVVNWSESSITWANKPPTGPSAVATTTITGTTKKWYEIDLTTFLKAEKAAGRNIVTLVLRSNTFTSTLCTFAADEAVNGPPLVIQP